MTIAPRVRGLVEPFLLPDQLELVDIEHVGGVLRVTVDRPGGVDLDSISQLTRDISRALDHDDVIPGGRYTLEVSSPGLERPLRTPAQFERAVGDRITVKTVPGTEGGRRLNGTLTEADDHGITVDSRHLRYDEIERARTVFEWGPGPKPGGSQTPKRKKAAHR